MRSPRRAQEAWRAGGRARAALAEAEGPVLAMALSRREGEAGPRFSLGAQPLPGEGGEIPLCGADGTSWGMRLGAARPSRLFACPRLSGRPGDPSRALAAGAPLKFLPGSARPTAAPPPRLVRAAWRPAAPGSPSRTGPALPSAAFAGVPVLPPCSGNGNRAGCRLRAVPGGGRSGDGCAPALAPLVCECG